MSTTILNGCAIVLSGKFEQGSQSYLQSIIKIHGGTFGSTITKGTTHLVVTEVDYERESAKVTAARARDDIEITTWDWIEECIKEKKLVDPKKYLPGGKPVEMDIEITKEQDSQDDNSTQNINEHETDQNVPVKKKKRQTRKKTKDDDQPKIDSTDNNQTTNTDENHDEQKLPARRKRQTRKNSVKDSGQPTTDRSTAKLNENEDEQEIPAKKKRRTGKNAAAKVDDNIPTTTTDNDANLNTNANDTSDSNTKKAKKRKTAASDPVEEPKMVTVIKKGKAPVDPNFHSHENYHVYTDNLGHIWDCVLNQTNVGANNNKFFVIQLLKHDSGETGYVTYTRWGRVGYTGQSKIHGPTSEWEARDEFEKKFRSKTGNKWGDVLADPNNFVSYKGKYMYLQRDYGDDPDGLEQAREERRKAKIPESKLHPLVQDVIRMMFDVGLWADALVSMNYDQRRLPLGKLSKNTINQGYEILRKIEKVIDGEVRGNLVELSNEFYTVIPHSFGMSVPPVINSVEMLKGKVDMVEALGEIQIATSIVSEAEESNTIKHPIDANYERLNLARMHPLDHDSEEFKILEKYVRNTHGDSHNWFNLKILEVYDIERQGEREKFKKLHNCMLLWHGSRKTNFAGILSQGLRIAPPHVPHSGYMFGKGVYFADCVSKSANYCCASGNDVAFMLLCEVALGDMLELVSSDYDAGNRVKNEGKHCTKGLGTIEPDFSDVTYLDDVIVPCGKTVRKEGRYLQYNEYIVYDTNQVLQKYLLKMKFDFKSLYR
ncbi:9812_t:CDS:1 [Paraglomus occultum]|uniref:Poly [ADP-ribose] polymerase n=1 Tax=Paraglomus occultum TaxID=144539 RepID=A0A9N8VJN3_9GLOM|nr:9812_t:CDS:1 [Paraglomus occultum]